MNENTKYSLLDKYWRYNLNNDLCFYSLGSGNGEG